MSIDNWPPEKTRKTLRTILSIAEHHLGEWDLSVEEKVETELFINCWEESINEEEIGGYP